VRGCTVRIWGCRLLDWRKVFSVSMLMRDTGRLDVPFRALQIFATASMNMPSRGGSHGRYLLCTLDTAALRNDAIFFADILSRGGR